MSNKVKILFIIDSLRTGGKERRLLQLIKGLQHKYDSFLCEIIILNQDVHFNDIFNLKYKIHFLKRNIE